MRKPKFWSRACPALDLVSALRDLSEPVSLSLKRDWWSLPSSLGESEHHQSVQGLVECGELLFTGYWTWSPRLGFMEKPVNLMPF